MINRKTTACPECDSTRIHGRSESDPDWHCNECGNDFDEPVTRTAKSNTALRPDTIARSLDDAEPGDLITDGGFKQ